MMANINDLKRLLWVLLNSDCVNFHTLLVDLRTFEQNSLFLGDSVNSFSIFRFCDDDTHRLIIKLVKLAKDRMYKIMDRVIEPE